MAKPRPNLCFAVNYAIEAFVAENCGNRCCGANLESVYLPLLAGVLAVLTRLSNARLHSIRLANGSFEASSSAASWRGFMAATTIMPLADLVSANRAPVKWLNIQDER